MPVGRLTLTQETVVRVHDGHPKKVKIIVDLSCVSAYIKGTQERNPERKYIMDIKEALKKEIKYLDSEIITSLQMAEKLNDLMVGRTYRFTLKQMKESYTRLLLDLNEYF